MDFREFHGDDHIYFVQTVQAPQDASKDVEVSAQTPCAQRATERDQDNVRKILMRTNLQITIKYLQVVQGPINVIQSRCNSLEVEGD